MKLKIINKNGNELLIGKCGETVLEIFNHEYQDGDWMIVDTNVTPGFYKIKLEDTIEETLIYVNGTNFIYHIPFKNNRSNLSPKSFVGDCHIISVVKATDEEVYSRRNLAINPYDSHTNDTFYPHAYANVETRNEATFAARNAIDGYFHNESHGSFPFQSWGINRNPDAEFTVDFGRIVEIDEILITLRADYPHDNYWKEVTLEFSDKTTVVANLEMSGKRQSIKFDKKVVNKVTLKKLIKGDLISPFPALTQFEVMGKDIK